MATFRPTKNTCELNFDDKFIFELPLHEDTADKIDEAFKKLKTTAPKDRAGVDEAYNTALDIIDGVLGEGAAEQIMTIYETPGSLEVIEVLTYIFNEWAAAYNKASDNIAGKMAAIPTTKTTATVRGGRR